jgi:Uma2 family endonuclease
MPTSTRSFIAGNPTEIVRVRNARVHLLRPKYDSMAISLQDFLDWEREADGWKYEWNNGRIEINEQSMKNTERSIVQHILRAFTATQEYANGGELLPETDCLLPSGQMRRPDIAYFTASQIAASKRGENPVPTFVIELISPNDRTLAIDEKLVEYFANGVQCAWYIYPKTGRICIASSSKNLHICSDGDICSAAPALDFLMKAAEFFV